LTTRPVNDREVLSENPPTNNVQLLEQIRDMTRLEVPHYWPLTTEALKFENKALVAEIVKLTGAIGANHTSSEAWATAEKLKDELNCKVALMVWMHVNMNSLEDVLWHREPLQARAASGLIPDVIFFHYEGPPAPPELVYTYAALMEESFPGVPQLYYHFPDWGMGKNGADFSHIYSLLAPPADYINFDLYDEDVAAVTMTLAQNKLGGLPRFPTLFHGGFYHSTLNRAGQGEWHSERCTVRRSPAALWNIGSRVKYGTTTDVSPVEAVWLYESFFGRCNMEDIVEDFGYYVHGWHGESIDFP
jgi:hypothetical protein